MANTYSLIASVSAGTGGSSSLDFTSVPQTYTDLLILVSARTSRASQVNDQIFMTFNGITTGYNWRWVYSSNGGVASGSSSTRYAGQATAASSTAGVFGNNSIYIPNYTVSKNKMYSVDSVLESNVANTLAYNISYEVGMWQNTSAITSISLTSETGNTFQQYTTATLYGIKNS